MIKDPVLPLGGAATADLIHIFSVANVIGGGACHKVQASYCNPHSGQYIIIVPIAGTTKFSIPARPSKIVEPSRYFL